MLWLFAIPTAMILTWLYWQFMQIGVEEPSPRLFEDEFAAEMAEYIEANKR